MSVCLLLQAESAVSVLLSRNFSEGKTLQWGIIARLDAGGKTQGCSADRWRDRQVLQNTADTQANRNQEGAINY